MCSSGQTFSGAGLGWRGGDGAVRYRRRCPTPTITLSESALALLRSRVEGGSRHVDDCNREAYRELARAGIMYPVSGFISGPEYLYRFTDEGWERRLEILGCAKKSA